MSKGRRRDAFTTIELLVALAIIVIMSGVAVVAMGPALRDARLRSGCRIVAARLNYARSYAVATNLTARVVFDSDHTVEMQVVATDSSGNETAVSMTTVGAKRQSLPDGVHITTVWKSGDVMDQNWVDFADSGQAEQALIEITDRDGQKMYVTVDPITGRGAVKTYDEVRRDSQDAVQIIHQ